ncbi:MAG: glycosyltransferase [Marinobacter sp.]|nr:glycosyltransferase [Marinobacter sp.]
MAESPLTIAMLLATPGKSWGGMEKHTAELVEALAHKGHVVHLVGHPAYQNRFSTSVHFHPMPMHLGRRNPVLHLKLRKLLRRLAPDLCHGQGNKAICLLSRLKLPAKQVGTIHGIKKNHQGLERMDAVIGVSQTVMATLNHPNKTLIYHGSSTGQLPPSSPSPFSTNSSVQAVSIGRLEPVKGFDVLIKVWKQLNNDERLTIIGEGSQRNSLEEQISATGLSSRVSLAGFQSAPESWLKHADVCIVSSHREGLSYVVIEALQAGCPVLATPVAGAMELLPATAVAENNSAEAIYQLLATHLPALKQLSVIERPAMEHARRELTIENMVCRTEDIYQKLLRSTGHD